jgi:hypothetical protein
MKSTLRDLCILAAIAAAATSQLGNVPVEPRPIAGGTFEASGAVRVPDTNGVLFVDDGQTRKIFWMQLSDEGAQIGPAVAVPLAADITDLEGITTDGTYFYVVGSQSKNVGFDGDGLARFTFDPVRKAVGSVESVRALKAFLAKNVRELAGIERRMGDEALNIEGLAWDPKGKRLLLGLRAPVSGTDALIVPLTLRDASGGFTEENLQVEGAAAIRLPLGGAGLRGLEFDPVSGRVLVITGAALNEENTDFRILEWDGGNTPTSLRELTRYPRKLKPEGITRVRLAGRDAMLVVFDVGSYEIMRSR